ncbi:hypothetical protein [Streptomyces sp. NBC_01235]|uniref:hypothetical protein n=1 Tax=Streptomyces sp. NBC_01235 TaxID=2903788 RepID=UPI003FA3D137
MLIALKCPRERGDEPTSALPVPARSQDCLAKHPPVRHRGLAHVPGDHVVHVLGWRDHAVLDAAGAQKVDPNLAPLSAYLGALGIPGLTAERRNVGTSERRNVGKMIVKL